MSALNVVLTSFVALSLVACSTTNDIPAGRADFVSETQAQAFSAKAQQQFGLDPANVSAALAQAEYQPSIIATMNRHFEGKPWAVYQAHMLTAKRIAGGKAFAQKHQTILRTASQKYGVPAKIVVAIIGVETMYGTNQGNFHVLDALATLSFDYPKRAPFFQSELANYLVICEKNQWPVRQLKGSYAGAFGIGQFMPSSYRQYAVSANGPVPEISSNPDDAILSVANYFKGHGWHSGEPTAIPVKAPASLTAPILPSMKAPKHTLAYWQAEGVQLPAAMHDLTVKAELVLVTNKAGERQAWLLFHNFYVIGRYNPSLNYALSVFCLSESL